MGRTVASPSSPSIATDDLCAACGKPGVEHRLVTRSFGNGASLMVIEGIPMISCPSCGQSTFTARTLHGIERLKALRASTADIRQVPVAAFSVAGA